MTYCKHRRQKAWLTAGQRESKRKPEEQESAGIKDERKLLGRGHFVRFRSESCIRPSMYSTKRSRQIQGHNKEVDVSTRAHVGTHKLA